MKNYTYLFLFSLLFLACREGEIKKVLQSLSITETNSADQSAIIDEKLRPFAVKKQGATVITVPQLDEFCIPDIVKSYRFIPLETTEEGIIGKIDRLCMDSTFIFILDRKYNAVFSFNNKGRFLKRIGNKGDSVGEYLSAHRITVDIFRKELCVLDDESLKLLYYNYNGDYLRTHAMPFALSDLDFLEDGIITATKHGENIKHPVIDKKKLVICDKNLKPTHSFFNELDLDSEFHFEVEEPLISFYDGVYFNSLLSDTIWRINKTSCDAMFIVNFPNRDHAALNKGIKKQSPNNVWGFINTYNHFAGNYLVTSDFFCASIYNKEKWNSMPLVYNRKTKHICYGERHLSGMQRLGDYLVYAGFDFVGPHKTFIRVIDPSLIEDIAKSIQGKDYDILPDSDKAFLKTLNRGDNPVLIMMELKNF